MITDETSFEFPPFKYDPLTDTVVILMSKNDYLQVRDETLVEFYTQLRFFYLFGMADRKYGCEILSKLNSDECIVSNMEMDNEILIRIVNRLISEKYIDSKCTENNLPKTINSLDDIRIVKDNILLTEKGKKLYNRLKSHDDQYFPDIKKDPFTPLSPFELIYLIHTAVLVYIAWKNTIDKK